MRPDRVTLVGGPAHGRTVTVDRSLRRITVPVPTRQSFRPADPGPGDSAFSTAVYHVHPWLEVALTPGVEAMGTEEALNLIAATLDTSPGELAGLILDRVWEARHHRNGKAHQ